MGSSDRRRARPSPAGGVLAASWDGDRGQVPGQKESRRAPTRRLHHDVTTLAGLGTPGMAHPRLPRRVGRAMGRGWVVVRQATSPCAGMAEIVAVGLADRIALRALVVALGIRIVADWWGRPPEDPDALERMLRPR